MSGSQRTGALSTSYTLQQALVGRNSAGKGQPEGKRGVAHSSNSLYAAPAEQIAARGSPPHVHCQVCLQAIPQKQQRHPALPYRLSVGLCLPLQLRPVQGSGAVEPEV